jgi:hypothetical protein
MRDTWMLVGSKTPTVSGRDFVMDDHLARVRKVADAAERAWSGAGTGSDVGVCVGVVAAIALLGNREDDGPDPGAAILASSDEEIARMLSEVWCLFTISRPELAFRCGPFGEWLNADLLDRTSSPAQPRSPARRSRPGCSS